MVVTDTQVFANAGAAWIHFPRSLPLFLTRYLRPLVSARKPMMTSAQIRQRHNAIASTNLAKPNRMA
jgi:hypothetical protein